ncbi:MAG: T9SS type A sorting domain-containing protein [Ignavibacteriaceae bacterium]
MNRIIDIIIIIVFAYIVSAGQGLSWKVAGKMPVPVFGGEAVAKDSLIYILGGYSDSLRRKVDFIQEFNPATNQWRVAGNMRIRRQGFYAGVKDDSLFILGGVSGSTQFRRYMEAWNFVNPPGFLTVDDNFDRIYPSGEIFGNKLYLIGGIQNHKPDSQSVQYLAEYDFAIRQITYGTDGPFNHFSAPAQQMTVLIDSTIYIFGGIYFGISPDIYRYQIKSRDFIKLGIKMPKGRAGGSAISLGNDKMIVFGGFNEGNISLNNSEIYTISGEALTYQPGPNLTYPRREFLTVKFKNSIYVFGGTSNNNINIPFIERLDLVTDIEDDQKIVPENHVLEQNYPNPFNPTTVISYGLQLPGRVTLKIFDLLGNEVATLVDEDREAGRYQVNFDGSELSSGIYFYSLTAGKMSIFKKMVLVK